jgi:hypothetical protein
MMARSWVLDLAITELARLDYQRDLFWHHGQTMAHECGVLRTAAIILISIKAV